MQINHRAVLAGMAAVEAPRVAVAQAGSDPIRIGWLGSLTGPASAPAVGFDRGVQFAAKTINAAGGVKGRMIEIVTRDTQGDRLRHWGRLMQQPRLMMLDEPSAGLSPVLVDRVLSLLAQLRAGGTAVLLVEQLVDKAVALAERLCALARGRVVLEEAASEPGLHARLEGAYMGVSA